MGAAFRVSEAFAQRLDGERTRSGRRPGELIGLEHEYQVIHDGGSMVATFTITRAGTYTVTSTVTFADGTMTKVTATVNVTAAAGAGC